MTQKYTILWENSLCIFFLTCPLELICQPAHKENWVNYKGLAYCLMIILGVILPRLCIFFGGGGGISPIGQKLRKSRFVIIRLFRFLLLFSCVFSGPLWTCLCFHFVIHLVNYGIALFLFWHMPRKYSFSQNICTFDVFSVCHSLGQSVTCIT